MKFLGLLICTPMLKPVSRQQLELKVPWLKHYLSFEAPSLVFRLEDMHAGRAFGKAPVNVVVATSECLETDVVAEITRYTFADDVVFVLPEVVDTEESCDDMNADDDFGLSWIWRAKEAECFEWTTPDPRGLRGTEYLLAHSG